jgi:flagellar basal body-associated protein FliL
VAAQKEVKVLRGPHELATDIKEQIKTLTEAGTFILQSFFVGVAVLRC